MKTRTYGKLAFVLCLAFLLSSLVSQAMGVECKDNTTLSIAALTVDGVLVPDGITQARTISLTGAVSSVEGVRKLSWRNNRGGAGTPKLYIGKYKNADLNGKWHIPAINLKPGKNTIEVTAFPLRGKPVRETLVVYCQQ